MHHNLRNLLFAVLSALGTLHAQMNNEWIDRWNDPSSSFNSIKQSFDSAWINKEQDLRSSRGHAFASREEQSQEKDGPYFLFKRMEWYYGPRVGVDGNMSTPGLSYVNFIEYLDQNEAARNMHNSSLRGERSSSSWSFVGPVGAPNGTGAGRINFVRFDPTNVNVIYAGAPAGGCWKTTDGGNSWTCLTDFLPVIGCSDLAIDPTNASVLYLATGDNDGGDSPSIGLLKSTDGGVTWNSTGLNFNIMQSRRIARVIIDPVNPQIIYCGTSAGIFKSYDAGTNFYQVSASGVKDMEMKPGDPNTLYACRTTFIKSTNGGATWTTISSGLPQASQVSRLAIAVTPNDPEMVYVLAGDAGTQGFQGFYASTNGGQNFTPRASFPNLLGWDPNGNDTDGQAWYDLSVASAPYDKDVVVVGGVNVWRSDDGGYSWYLNAHWYGGGGAPYVHADIHAIEFRSGINGTYYIGCDGGVFRTTNDGNTFSDISANMGIAQIYKLGASATNAGTIITGHQDNGTNLKTGSNYEEVLGGDGMDCFIDRTTDNNMFGELYYGDFYRSTNGGNSWQGITSGLSGNAGWVTPWKQDPVLPNVLYAGYGQVFISTNLGTSWSQLGNLPNSSSLTEIEIAPTNRNYIYTTNGLSIYRTTDGGQNWGNITGTLITNGNEISGIAINPHNEKEIWISMSGYSVTNKSYYSPDAGTTWINISSGLPNIPANCIKAVPGTGNHLVFIGCDAGVYYRHDNSNGWQPYFNSLPYAPLSDFEIFEPTMTLRASTYGRGVWECPIESSLLSPLVSFNVNDRNICTGTQVSFTDASTQNPLQWSWSFPGGNPATSSIQNPVVTYNIPGTYPVTLSVNNGNAGGSATYTSYITVQSGLQPSYTEDFSSSQFLPSGWIDNNPGDPAVFWQWSATIGNLGAGCAYFDNYNNITGSAHDEMITPGFNLSGYISPVLSFDVAYARYNASRSDTLEVLISSDCGATWSRVFIKGGTQLSTANDQTSAFTPGNNQWRTETISLAAYANSPSLQIAFRNRGYHGQFIWLDNIGVSATANAPVTSLFSSALACTGDTVRFTDLSYPSPTSWNWTFSGANTTSSSLQDPAAIWSTPGTYTVTLISTNAFGSDTSFQTITVHPRPVADAGSDTSYCSSTYVTLNGSGGSTYSWNYVPGLYNTVSAQPSVVMNSSRTFTLTVTDSIGCMDSDTVRITIHPLPAFSVNALGQNICPGDTLRLTCSNTNFNYTWNPSAGLNTNIGDTVYASPVSSTTYTVTTVDTNGCTGAAVKTVNILPYTPVPTVLVWGFNLTCSVPAASYQWYLNGNPIPGATQQTYQATQVGMYQVEAYNLQGCASGISSAMLVNALPEVGISRFIAMPNPSTGIFNIEFECEGNEMIDLEIFNAEGQRVYSERHSAGNRVYRNTIDLSSYGSGMYSVRITGGTQVAYYRLILL